MATLQYNSVELSTEKFKNLNCALCLTFGDLIENLNFCIECQNFYCPSCLNHHLKSRQAKFQRTQQTNDRNINRDKPVGQNLNTKEKSSAINRSPVESVTNGHPEVTSPQTAAYQKLAATLRQQQFELSSLGSQKDTIINLMKQFKESLATLILEFEMSVEEKIQAQEQETKKKLNKEIQQTEQAMKNLKVKAQNSEHASTDTRSDAYNKEDNKRKTSSSESFSNMQNILETAVEDFTYRINKTGSYLIEESGQKFVQVGQHDVKMAEDRATCDINDMCQFQDATILCDWGNSKIKRLNKSFELQDSCAMPGIPWSVCETGPSEVAVSLFLLESIQFVKLSPTAMKSARSFRVGQVCRGVCFQNNKLVVSCAGGGTGEGPGHLRIFNKFGVLLNIVQYKAARDPVFSCPYHLTVSQGLVYLTDRDKGLVCLQWSGLHNLRPAQTSTKQHLTLAKGMCEGEDKDLFICDFKNGSVIQLDMGSGQSKVVVHLKSKLTGPQSICYDKEQMHLVVASGNSNHIQIYQQTPAGRQTYL